MLLQKTKRPGEGESEKAAAVKEEEEEEEEWWWRPAGHCPGIIASMYWKSTPELRLRTVGGVDPGGGCNERDDPSAAGCTGTAAAAAVAAVKGLERKSRK